MTLLSLPSWSAVNDKYNLSDSIVCDKSLDEDGNWTQDADLSDFVEEAKKRGICVYEPKNCPIEIASNAFEINPGITEVQVKHMVDLCSCDFDKTSTASMANSTYETSECLENIIIKLMAIVTKQHQKTSSEQINKIRQGYVEMLSEVYHGYVGCDGTCGTMWSGMAMSDFNLVLSELALKIVRRQNY